MATIESDVRTVREVATQRVERRAHERYEVAYPARLTFGRVSYACTVLNISVGGAQLELATVLQPWTVVTLAIEDFGSFHGRVMWSRGVRHGLRFLDAARHLIERANEAPPHTEL